MNDNGEPGAQGSIQIRGANTFSADGNSPLYVVDGVITDNAAAISPNDIERVEILKDAASASIYGARSAARRDTDYDKAWQGRQVASRCAILQGIWLAGA
jgi:TonB-dependent SusC/RagA subfamily outer membrane receptor